MQCLACTAAARQLQDAARTPERTLWGPASACPQVKVCQQLGYWRVFNSVHPEMHYKLRMFRADEYAVCQRLHKMSTSVQNATCFLNFSIDGRPRKITQGPNSWQVSGRAGGAP